MALSSDLISQFVSVTRGGKKDDKETIAYGTVAQIDTDDKTKEVTAVWVRLDGANALTPLSRTTDVSLGDRVIVMIKNHSAVITGNLTSPSARTEYVKVVEQRVVESDGKVTELDLLMADKVNTKDLYAELAKTEEFKADKAYINDAKIAAASIENVKADLAELDTVVSNKIDAETVESEYAKIANLNATNLEVTRLNADHSTFKQTTTDKLDAANASIADLDASKLNAADAAITYANIDFSNIGSAAIEYFYATSGLIEDVTVENGTVAGRLVGVTISGDIIEGNTIVAEKLVIKGEDGLYYKLNTDGVGTEAEQTEYNSLNGSVITAKSITATKISVDDLVAFDATIGGFTITDDAIYSDVKDDDGNTTRGIHLNADGRFNFGDESNYIKYYQDENGEYKLVVSAASILYALNGKQCSIADLGQIGEYVRVTTYEGEPCIELGENDSDFRLIITNTRIMFMEGSSVPAYINNQSLHITKAVIEEEIQQGEFVWKVRQNGNMGLMWKGDT